MKVAQEKYFTYAGTVFNFNLRPITHNQAEFGNNKYTYKTGAISYVLAKVLKEITPLGC